MAESLGISSDASHFVDEKGRPFFWLADTAWMLTAKLSLEEADMYFAKRAAQGFNVVQLVGYYEDDCRHAPTAGGCWAMDGGDPARPNSAYFDHVEQVMERATAHGLIVVLLPTWGHLVTPLWAGGEPILDVAKAESYGRFLGKRFGDRPGLVWVVGGDRPVPDEPTRAVWRALAAGLRQTEKTRHLMTFHPPGVSSSSDHVAGETWLDFHAQQSGHARRDIEVWQTVAADRSAFDGMPVLDMEMVYEDHPVAFDADNGRFDDADVRRSAYRSVLAGAAGVSYGSAAVWQFVESAVQGVATSRPSVGWQASLDLPGAGQMQHLRALVESRSMEGRVVDDTAVVAASSHPSDHPVACRIGRPAVTTLMVYFPVKQHWLEINTTGLAQPRLRVTWFDPRNGETAKPITLANSGRLACEFPQGGPDWVLIIDGVDQAV